jgi:hypothetical protein
MQVRVLKYARKNIAYAEEGIRANKNIVDVELSSMYSILRGEGGTPCPMDRKPTPNNLL